MPSSESSAAQTVVGAAPTPDAGSQKEDNHKEDTETGLEDGEEDGDDALSIHSSSSNLSFIDVLEGAETTTTGTDDVDREEFDFVDEGSDDEL